MKLGTNGGVQLKKACESCAQMGNPESYIRHLCAALDWYESHNYPGRSSTENNVFDVLLRHPDLPIMLLTPNGDGEYDTCYHEGIKASVEHLLRASDVDKLYGSTFGLDYMRYYADKAAVEDCIECWLWDNTSVSADTHMQDARDFDAWNEAYDAWNEIYRPIARMMAEDMPWEDYVIIRACL